MDCGGCRNRSKSECPGCCRRIGLNGYETGINSIVELEIHYSKTKEPNTTALIFDKLYTITSTQRKELKDTGLEGYRFEDLYSMSSQIINHLAEIDADFYTLSMNADISYISDDVQNNNL